MNKALIKLFNIIAIIGALLGILFSFLPLFELAIFPATIALILGLIAFYASKKQNYSFGFSRIVVILALLALLISAGKQLFTNNELNEETQKELQQKEQESEEDAIKELDDLDELE